MKEGARSSPETAEEWISYIAEFAHKSEFGSPDFLAINDFRNLRELYSQINMEPYTHLAKASGEAKLSPEQRVTVTLQRIALLEHTIEQNQSGIPGYASAYEVIYSSFNSMIGTAAQEARIKFPNQEEKQAEYTQHIYGLALDYVSSSIYDNQNLNLYRL